VYRPYSSSSLDLSELGDEDVNLSDGEYEDFGPSARRGLFFVANIDMMWIDQSLSIVLREIIRDELGISKKAMKTLNSIPNAMSKRIVTEAAGTSKRLLFL